VVEVVEEDQFLTVATPPVEVEVEVEAEATPEMPEEPEELEELEPQALLKPLTVYQ
jgi:hypothetical protein